MNVLDEFGNPWSVERGDPAFDACRVAAGRGLRDLVVPQALLLHGLEEIRRSGYQPPPEPPSQDAFMRWCSLLDFVQALALVPPDVV